MARTGRSHDSAGASDEFARGERSSPQPRTAFASTCDFAAWPDVPIRVAAAADDRFFPLDFQRQVARERLGVDVDALPGGHLNALSQPEALAAYLLGT